MARKQVIEIVCERCERTEYVDPKEYRDLPDLTVSFGSEPGDVQQAPSPAEPNPEMCYKPEMDITFEDLCSSCKKTVKNLLEQATKKISWKRNKEEPEVEVVVPEGTQG